MSPGGPGENSVVSRGAQCMQLMMSISSSYSPGWAYSEFRYVVSVENEWSSPSAWPVSCPVNDVFMAHGFASTSPLMDPASDVQSLATLLPPFTTATTRFPAGAV